MNNVEEIIKLAWKTSPIDTEYYVSKHLKDLSLLIKKLEDLCDDYESTQPSESRRANDRLSSLNREYDNLQYLVSYLRSGGE